jgi:hypothetical protein
MANENSIKTSNRKALGIHISLLEAERNDLEKKLSKINQRLVIARTIEARDTHREMVPFLDEFIDRNFDDWLFDFLNNITCSD